MAKDKKPKRECEFTGEASLAARSNSTPTAVEKPTSSQLTAENEEPDALGETKTGNEHNSIASSMPASIVVPTEVTAVHEVAASGEPTTPAGPRAVGESTPTNRPAVIRGPWTIDKPEATRELIANKPMAITEPTTMSAKAHPVSPQPRPTSELDATVVYLETLLVNSFSYIFWYICWFAIRILLDSISLIGNLLDSMFGFMWARGGAFYIWDVNCEHYPCLWILFICLVYRWLTFTDVLVSFVYALQ